MIGFSDLLNLARTVDRLLQLETKHGKAIDILTEKLLELDRRVTSLEAREEIVVAKAQAAAGVAASQVAMTAMSDISRRVGGLEERSRALPAPAPIAAISPPTT